MTTPSDWFQDERLLLGELKHRDARAPRTPAIAGYDRLRELRRGGQGVVYTAVQTSTRRRVAIKVLLDGAWASDARRRRFEREIDLIASLRHPNIVRLYDSGRTDDEHPYYVMEFIDGRGLDELIVGARGLSSATAIESLDVESPAGVAPPPTGAPIADVRATLTLFSRICDAVHYAHQRGVIHRDLKPSNIRIDPEGQPHVLDFGLAAHAAGTDPDATQVSRTGEFMGSLPWASPEHVEGRPERIDVRSDVYSLGVLLFQLLTGTFPYGVSGALRDVLENIQRGEPQRPSRYRREIDDETETIALKCLQKDPERRYQSAGDLAREIRRYLAGEPIEAKRDSAWYTVRKKLRRYRLATAVSGVFLALSVVALAVLAVLRERALSAERVADERRVAVERAREAEAVARQQAEQESAQARAVRDFLIDMLSRPLDVGRDARVADVLDQAARKIDADAALAPETEAGLRYAIGVAYGSLGLYAEARPLLERAYQIGRERKGDDDPDTNWSLSSLAWLARLEGRLEESETLYRQALDAASRAGESRESQRVTLTNDLAIVLAARGNLDEAEQLQRHAYERSLALQGERSQGTLAALGNLASVMHSRGRLAEAEALFRRRLELTNELFGPDHLESLTAANNLAALLGDMNRFDEAALLNSAVYDARRRMLGDEHPDTLSALNNVAFALWHGGDLTGAEPLLRSADEAMTRRLGTRHPMRLSTLNNLASLLHDLGRLEEAETLYREVLDIRRATLGPEHTDTLTTLNNLAGIAMTRDDPYAALPMYEAVVAGSRVANGPENPSTLTAELNLAYVLRQLGRPDEGEALAWRVWLLRDAIFGCDDPSTLAARHELSKLRLEARQADVAAALSAEIVHAAETGPLGAEHWMTAVFRSQYGRSLGASGELEHAARELQHAFDTLCDQFGPDHHQTRTVRERIEELTGVPIEPASGG